MSCVRQVRCAEGTEKTKHTFMKGDGLRKICNEKSVGANDDRAVRQTLSRGSGGSKRTLDPAVLGS